MIDLTDLAKVLEKTVAGQLIVHMKGNRLSIKFQSGFRSGHSTEMALFRVLNDIPLATDSGQTSILLLLYLTAAFHTVDHMVLI